MTVRTCKARLKEQKQELERRIFQKRCELLKVPREEYRKKKEHTDLYVRDAEVYMQELEQALEIIRKWAVPGDKAEIVDKNDVETRISEFWEEGRHFDEPFVAVYRCSNPELNMVSRKSRCDVTWIIGLMSLETL